MSNSLESGKDLSESKIESMKINEERIYNQILVLERNIQSKIETYCTLFKYFFRLNAINLEISDYQKIYSDKTSSENVKNESKECISKLEIMKKEVHNGLIIDYNSQIALERLLYPFICLYVVILVFLILY